MEYGKVKKKGYWQLIDDICYLKKGNATADICLVNFLNARNADGGGGRNFAKFKIEQIKKFDVKT